MYAVKNSNNGQRSRPRYHCLRSFDPRMTFCVNSNARVTQIPEIVQKEVNMVNAVEVNFNFMNTGATEPHCTGATEPHCIPQCIRLLYLGYSSHTVHTLII